MRYMRRWRGALGLDGGVYDQALGADMVQGIVVGVGAGIEWESRS